MLPAPDRASGLRRLKAFVPRAGRQYASRRNYDLGAGRHEHVSRLSPYIRHRLILEEEVLRCVLDGRRPESTEKFVQEVLWRTYFKGWLEQHPQVWKDYRTAVERLAGRLDLDAPLRKDYLRAVKGETGIDCFDHWVHELTATGYLHNHARMWFSSIWVFTLGLPWQLGADFFYRHLLDGDPASNTLGWRWVSGLHTMGKNYVARASNIARYTEERFNPEGRLVEHAGALKDESAPKLERFSEPPVADIDRPYGLLLTCEDCHPESLGLDPAPSAVVGVADAEARSPLPVDDAVQSFTRGALQDALRRAHARFGVKAELIDGPDWPNALRAWAQSHGLALVATAHTPVGPTADALETARAALSGSGTKLVGVVRDYDRLIWPHTARGFFNLKKKIPDLLASLGAVTRNVRA